MKPPSERRFPRLPSAPADAGASPGAAAFLEDLIDACVMECIHVWRRGLKPLCGGQGNAFAWLVQRGCKPLLHITHLHQTLNAPSHPIRNRLDRLSTDSPDLLAMIKKEGKV